MMMNMVNNIVIIHVSKLYVTNPFVAPVDIKPTYVHFQGPYSQLCHSKTTL